MINQSNRFNVITVVQNNGTSHRYRGTYIDKNISIYAVSLNLNEFNQLFNFMNSDIRYGFQLKNLFSFDAFPRVYCLANINPCNWKSYK